MQFTVELGYKVTESLGSNLGRPMWGCGMSGIHMPQGPVRPFLTARRVCGPSSTLPRTPGQLPGPDLSRRILFSEKQAQRGMFLAERSAGKFDRSLSHFPYSHQGETGWCQTHTSSQVVLSCLPAKKAGSRTGGKQRKMV